MYVAENVCIMKEDESMKMDDLFAKLQRSEKDVEDVGVMAPKYNRNRFEEYFALAFFRENTFRMEYPDIKIHDLQKSGSNSMDLISEPAKIGIEVTQCLNDIFQKEESQWNKPVCKGNSQTLVHYWKNQPVSFECIETAISKKNDKYDAYMSDYGDIVSDIDLFVYGGPDVCVQNYDCNFLLGKDENGNEILISYPDKSIGYNSYDMVADKLSHMLIENNCKYRKVFIVFGNCWFYFIKAEHYKYHTCIMTEDIFCRLSHIAINMQKGD